MDRDPLLDLAVRLALLKALVDDEQSNRSNDGSIIEKIFDSEKKVQRLLSEGSNEAAVDLARWRYNQNASVHKAPVLLQYYVTLIKSDSPLRAGEIRDELVNLIRGFNVSAKASEIYAGKLREDDSKMEALFFYQLSIHFCQQERNISDVINVSVKSCAGVALIVPEAIKQGNLSKQLVKRHIIPCMVRAKTGMARHLMVNKKEISKAIAICLHCIEQCLNEVDDIDGRESTLREAVSLLRNNLGTEAVKHKIYGNCLNNLGHALMQQRKFALAASIFEQAIVAKRQATDYNSVAEKNNDIVSSQRGLAVARSGQCMIQ